MNVSMFSQMAYEYKHNWTLSENKPNQTQFQTGHRCPELRPYRVYTSQPDGHEGVPQGTSQSENRRKKR